MNYYFFYERTGFWRVTVTWVIITCGTPRISTTKSCPCQPRKHPYQQPQKHPYTLTNKALLPIMWLLAASCCLSVRFRDPTDLFYMSRAECSGTGLVKSSASCCSGFSV